MGIRERFFERGRPDVAVPGARRGAAVGLAGAFLAAVTCLIAAHAATAKPAPMGPFPVGRLDVRLQWEGPLGFCDVLLSRDGAVVRRGKPDPGTGTITFERLPPGLYDVRAVSRSFVPRGEPGPGRAHRVAVWMRNGWGTASRELRARRNDKPEIVKVALQWSRPVAEYLVQD